jgi:transposase
MSLRAPVVYLIPEDTERAARASFPQGHPLMHIADELGPLYANAQFASLFSCTGQPALDPARLAMITVFQFMAGLSDEQAADAARGHLAWKYALALPLHDPGFDASVLSEFRARLVTGGLELLLLETLLERVRDRGLLKARGRMRTDSTHVLAAVRSVSRLVTCGETRRAALNAVASAAPAWLAAWAPPEWFDRYSHRVDEYRLPKDKSARADLAAVIGTDGQYLLTALDGVQAVAALADLPAVRLLRAVWIQQFYAPDEHGVRRWREEQDQPPAALQILSPYDDEARLSVKRDLHWVGYKVHLTETCEEQHPHLITHVETTPATQQDDQALPSIHQGLAERDLLPSEHLLDAGYGDSVQLVGSQQEHGVRLVGPVPADSSWQARAGQGYAVRCFAVDWERQQVRCPAGHLSREWKPVKEASGRAGIHVEFGRATCAGCAGREQCTRATKTGRTLHLLPREQYEALAARRVEQQTAAFKAAYAARAGVEGTLSQGLRLGDLRQSRYRGQAKAHLQNIIIAVAVNLRRLEAWWQERPLARSRVSAFARLGPRSARASTALAA